MKKVLHELFNILFITLTISQKTSGHGLLSTSDSEGTAPVIYDGPTDQIAVHGSTTVVMKCRVSGVPEPKISWIKNNLEIKGKRFEILPTGDLKFNRLNFGDSGAYTCKAENKFGTKMVNANLEVKHRTVIVQKPENQEVNIGKDAMFRFNDRHDDSLTVEVEWLKDGSPIDFDNQERYQKLADNSLIISRTTQLDAGEYTCVVRTEVDEARASAKLNVIGISAGSGLPLIAPTNFEMVELVNTTCALLKWDRASTENIKAGLKGYIIRSWIAEDIEGSFQEKILDRITKKMYLTDLIPYSEYVVRLYGFNSTSDGPSEYLTVHTTDKNPSTVENLEAYALGSSAILVNWDKPKTPNGRIKKYRVYTQKISGSRVGDEQEVPLGNALATSVKLENLEPDTRYRITVSASNAYGEGHGYFLEEKTAP